MDFLLRVGKHGILESPNFDGITFDLLTFDNKTNIFWKQMPPKYLFVFLQMLFLHLLHGNHIDLVSDPHQGSTLTCETGGPPGPPEANSTRPNSNLGGPVYNFIKSCILIIFYFRNYKLLFMPLQSAKFDFIHNSDFFTQCQSAWVLPPSWKFTTKFVNRCN